MLKDENSLETLEGLLGYKFKNKEHIIRALTHTSYVNEVKAHDTAVQSNERLEFLGDSILGYRSHTGAGAITSNVKSDKTLVRVKTEDGFIETGLKKFGAMLGDFVEVGCNSVLNPGTVIGRNTNVYPLSSVRGTVPPDHIYKSGENIVPKQKR